MSPDHTCHAGSPCHTGGLPAADFIDAAAGPSPTTTKEQRMPYIVTICKTCDMLVTSMAPHGPEDEFCEGDGGYERVGLYTMAEIERTYVAVDAERPWRVGRKVGRTIYRQSGREPSDADVLIGVMDTPELAASVVAAITAVTGEQP